MRKSCMVEPLWRAPKAVGHSWIASKCVSGIVIRASYGVASLGPLGTLTEGPQQQVWTVAVSEGPSQRQEARGRDKAVGHCLSFGLGSQGTCLEMILPATSCFAAAHHGHLVQIPNTGHTWLPSLSFQGQDSLVFQLLFILRARATHRVTVPPGCLRPVDHQQCSCLGWPC